MFVKVQFFKYTVCISLYFFVCIILLITKKNFISKEVINITMIEHQQKTLYTSITDRIIEKSVEKKINTLQKSNYKNKTNILQKNMILLQQMSNICRKYNLITVPTKRHFLYSTKHKSLYCWIRKVASTSFIKLFSDMNNRRLSHNFYKEVDFLSPKRLEDLQYLANNDIFKLLVVRHPFQRLVSSYRDRIEDNSRYTAQAWLYARQIFHFSRPQLFRSKIPNSNILQTIFLPDRKLKMVPSFQEFLEWLLRQPPDRDDVHWAQYHTHCAVCNISYSFILKLEDYSIEEINYVLSKLRLDRHEVYLPELHYSLNGVTDFNVTCKYFSNLTSDMVLKLYERYKIDFEMYNYQIDEYLPCAKRKRIKSDVNQNDKI